MVLERREQQAPVIGPFRQPVGAGAIGGASLVERLGFRPAHGAMDNGDEGQIDRQQGLRRGGMKLQHQGWWRQNRGDRAQENTVGRLRLAQVAQPAEGGENVLGVEH